MSKQETLDRERERMEAQFKQDMQSENKKDSIRATRAYNQWIYDGKPVAKKKKKKAEEITENDSEQLNSN